MADGIDDEVRIERREAKLSKGRAARKIEFSF
jgi:hypothetical protein